MNTRKLVQIVGLLLLCSTSNAHAPYQNATRFSPGKTHVQRLALTAKEFMQKGKHSRALKLLDHGIEHNPRFAPLYYLKGKSFRMRGLYEAADRFLTRSIELNNDIAGAWWERCRTRNILGQLQTAILDCREAITLAGTEEMYLYASDLHIAAKEPQHAIDLLKLGITKSSKVTKLVRELSNQASDPSLQSELSSWFALKGPQQKYRLLWMSSLTR